jgi:hypothetical protein
LEMGVLHFLWSIRKLIFLSMVIGIALTGMLTSPMLMMPDQVGWPGMGSMGLLHCHLPHFGRL